MICILLMRLNNIREEKRRVRFVSSFLFWKNSNVNRWGSERGYLTRIHKKSFYDDEMNLFAVDIEGWWKTDHRDCTDGWLRLKIERWRKDQAKGAL